MGVRKKVIMITICPGCGSHKWDKEVDENVIVCPNCGEKWDFIKKPLYILTGCSGIGKTVTAREIQKLTTDYVVLDADLFYNIMPHDTEKDDFAQVEQMENLSKGIMQCGKPVVWAMAGNIDKLSQTYHYRFFSAIHVLALVCGEESLRKRMTEGRKITNEGWINSSVEYNDFFRTHEKIGEVRYETLDTEGKTVSEAAEAVLSWLREH